MWSLIRGGALINREEFTPYGETSFGSFARKRYRFTGKERDEESGLNYHGARYYAPWLGRWVSCDPIGSQGDLNLYSCCYNNSINFSDPDGTDPQKSQESQTAGSTSQKKGVDHYSKDRPEAVRRGRPWFTTTENEMIKMLREKQGKVKVHMEKWGGHSAWRKEFHSLHDPDSEGFRRGTGTLAFTMGYLQRELHWLKRDFDSMTGDFYIFEHAESSKREKSLRQKIITLSVRIERMERQQMLNDETAEELEIDSYKALISERFKQVGEDIRGLGEGPFNLKPVPRDKYNSIVDTLDVIRQQTDELFRRESELRERYWPSCNNSACEEESGQNP